jgi:hypothetical protein
LICYLVPFDLGLRYSEILMRSPLVSFIAAITSFVISCIAWIPAFLIYGIVLGKYDFAKRVFALHSADDFSVAVALVFIFVPIRIILSNLITHIHYRGHLLSSLVFIILIAMTSSTFEYLMMLNQTSVYIFSCLVFCLIYLTTSDLNTPRREGVIPQGNIFDRRG